MNKKIMNQIVNTAARKQNDKLKLNAGQWREAVAIIFDALYSLDLSVLSAADKKKKKASVKKTTKKKIVEVVS